MRDYNYGTEVNSTPSPATVVSAGAERRGVKGLFEGLGSGALATLTRPTLGVLDLAHFTLRGIRR